MTMIIGTGIDIIEIKRIEKAAENNLFIKKIFTENEIEYLRNKNIQSMAGLFCAKEAVSKSLGTGISGFSWRDIEIMHEGEKPFVNLHENAQKIADEKKILNVQISISHCREYAVSMAVAEG